MPSIQFKNSASAKEDAAKAAPIEAFTPVPTAPAPTPISTPAPAPTPEPFVLPQLRKNKYNIQIEWVRHSRLACTVYLFIGIMLTAYYSAAFLTQYGTFDRIVDIKPVPILSESILTRVVMAEWLLLAAVLLLGMGVFRRIFMPLYIYLAVMATNGTLILFVVKFKQFTEGKIPHDDLSLNLVGILLVTATAHNLVYLYAMHLHLSTHHYYRIRRVPAPAAQEKNDLP
ncbi:hypothetical protein GCK72_016451 [Caenorhabditis remanei]|uniref:Uncharacterized protein n=1 Tax=Caenorhabditis remanei TaxID=31234 RepID=A0A6A5G4Q2_CAERE|nr:hypothetical protein GCK72_016451 [Caenorhabditis remanei]KAF1749906.1 hypothetical protein GCK72_016451 [Caenorhabditis remanei]